MMGWKLQESENITGDKRSEHKTEHTILKQNRNRASQYRIIEMARNKRPIGS